MTRSTTLLRTFAGLSVLALSAATCNPPDATAFTVSESVGRQGQFEFTDGPIRRQVRVTIPAGALEGAAEGNASLGVSTSTAPPVSAVRFEVGAPAAGVAVIDEQGNPGFDFDWTLPEGCEGGCEVVVPVTISHVGEGEAPGLG